MSSNTTSTDIRHARISGLKDEVLFRLGDDYNTAQFASFSPSLSPRFSRLSGREPNHFAAAAEDTAAELLALSGEKSVNVRSFLPDNPQTTDFAYGLKSIDDVVGTLRKFSAKGLYTIVNETIDIHDGGVSGVVSGNLVEFSPDDTPRCVEKPGTVSLSRGMARHILAAIYPFVPPFDEPDDVRLEFSLHPLRRGHRQEHVIVWEASREDTSGMTARPAWPNRFSPLVGDKTFGLLVADASGLPVPRTTVISRRLAPFTFGTATGCGERWLRTAPAIQTPGKFTTTRGWSDPYLLMAAEDKDATAIAAILSQDGVAFQWSGACVCGSDGLLIEGCRGDGERFMTGEVLPEDLPGAVVSRVRDLYARAEAALGPVRFEWVDDGTMTWVVQLHLGATGTSVDVIVEGEADVWHDFDASQGLDALRAFVTSLETTIDHRRHGIRIGGRFGRTSHMADILRKAGLPARAA